MTCHSVQKGFVSIIFVLLMAVPFPAVAGDRNKDTDRKPSIDKAIALGRRLSAEMDDHLKLLADPLINDYMTRLGQNIIRNSDAGVPFRIKVVDSDQINAFALPGGFFYINSGLILAADDEAELAAVIAHEIGHLAARQGTEQVAPRPGASLLIPIQWVHFSCKDEAEADYRGLQYMYRAGYDPAATVSFFKKLQTRERATPGSVSKLFSTHLPTAGRIKMTNKEIEEALPPRDQYIVTTSEFNRIKARLVQFENRKPSEDANKPSLRRPTQPLDPGNGVSHSTRVIAP